MSLFSDDFLDGAQAGQWEPVKNNFKYYSGAQEWAMLKPGKSEVLAFLDEISKSIKADSSYYLYTFMPSLKIQRAQAITDIYNWVDLKDRQQIVFSRHRYQCLPRDDPTRHARILARHD